MDQYFLWCHSCFHFSSSPRLICSLCQSTAVEQRISNNNTSLQNLDANLTMLSERLANLVQALHDLTNRVNSVPKKLPATEKMIENIEWAEFCSEKCSICIEEQNFDIRKLNCGHCFHHDCLLPWLKIQRTCPSCRYELLDN